MINKIALSSLLFVSSLSIAQTNDANWYAGATIGFNHGSGDSDVPSNKYGIIGGYQLNDWLAVEAEIGKLESDSGTYCNDSFINSQCVTLTQKYSHLFLGLRAERMATQIFGFTARLGAARTNFSSNIAVDNNKLNYSTAAGLIWKIGDSTKITLELQQIEYALVNDRYENEISSNLAFTMAF